MVRPLTKVIYQPERDSTNEYVVLVNPDEFRKWKEGAFQVLWSNQGSQGILSTPSRQQLDNDFGTHADTDVVKQILEKGKEQAGKSINTGNVATNQAKGSSVVDTRGKSLSGIQAGAGYGGR
ncbi:hypothetical protein DAEQUDRAFT_723939 [Daedalea quercina L-15889]|uniref:Ribosome maturation protein SDO1/SBDS N-terminal domain-containing protein n=1 Tax=Daedalea quercina L-15889 TaxID=1314783 RepID=A0A165S210_9APHY|nr:hypothetical protein DAEQUDRAFT_723939 [Daedalea quercina L-15889]